MQQDMILFYGFSKTQKMTQQVFPRGSNELDVFVDELNAQSSY